MIKNVILDMGNVLLSFDPEVSLNTFVENEEDRAIIRKELFQGPEWILGDRGTITNEQRYEPVSKRVPQRLHPQLKDCVEKWNICMQPIPGAKEFCEYLKARGYKVYVLSNACNDFYNYFPRFEEVSYFDGVMVSSDVHMIKPDKDIFEHFLSTYGLAAEECLFIDDVLPNVEGAKKCGICAFHFHGDFEDVKKEFQL